jgi:hypothetical protein
MSKGAFCGSQSGFQADKDEKTKGDAENDAYF